MVLHEIVRKIWRPGLLSVSMFFSLSAYAGPDIYALCRNLSEERRFGKLVSVADSLLSEDLSEDERDWLYLQSAQGYVMMDSLKKGKVFFSKISSEDFSAPGHKATYYNIAAILALKSEMDFSHALHYMRKSVELAEENGDILNLCSIYCNIAELYNLRNDTLGLDYALKAHELAIQIGDTVASCYTSIQAGSISLMAGHEEEALHFAEEAEMLTHSEGAQGYSGYVNILFGKIYYAMGDYDMAELYYRKLLADSLDLESSLAISAYYGCSMLEIEKGRYEEAERLLLKSAEYSDITGNVEELPQIMKGLAELYRITGDSAKAIENYASLLEITDSLSLIRKERDFNRLLIEYEEEEHTAEVQRRELALQKYRVNIFFQLVVLLSLSFVAIYLYMAYRKKNEMYAKLAEQYRHLNLRMKNLENSLVKESSEIKDVGLWKKIEQMMSGDLPYYREKDASLEGLAENLGTNRTYVSRVINKFAGVSFSSYINIRRIEEAVKRLESPGDKIPIKVLADELGFNSSSSFVHKFTKEVGCPPAKYRELAAKEH